VTAKPTVSELGIDIAAQVWHRSGHGDGAIEVAFVPSNPGPDGTSPGPGSTSPAAAPGRAGPGRAAPAPGRAGPAPDRVAWVLMRVAGDPDQRVLVFDRHEWECFLDGARNGEFDAAAG
jgi:Domain of unknown function (DUF397)